MILRNPPLALEAGQAFGSRAKHSLVFWLHQSKIAVLVPSLLLMPALIWIIFFFLLPLALMCWRSLAGEGFSFDTYAVLFTSPLYTKVMITTVKIATMATLGALVLAYPVAYMLAAV